MTTQARNDATNEQRRIADAIKAYRADREASQAQMAYFIGVKTETVRQWESCRRNPARGDSGTYAKLRKLLGV
jgi:DNA-binding transcriptional regulator YiaG